MEKNNKQKMHRLLKHKIFATAALLLVSFASQAGDRVEDSKQYTFSYPVTSETAIEVVNRYGNVHINTWDEDSVRFEINVIANGKSEKAVDKLLNRVEIEVKSFGYFINVSTLYGGKGTIGGAMRNTLDLTKELFNDQNISVNYKVFMPSGNKLSIKNRFGDIYLPDIEGDLTVSVAYGDIRARSIITARKLECKYGKIDIGTLGEATLDVSYSEVVIKEANSLFVESRSTEYHLDQVNILRLSSRNDKFFIGEAKQVFGEQYLTDLNVNLLTDEADVTSKYGDININHVKPQFGKISFDGNGTDYYLNFEESSALVFEVSLESGKSFSYPVEQTKISSDNTSDNIRYINGSIGKQLNGSVLNIKAKSSYIKVKYGK